MSTGERIRAARRARTPRMTLAELAGDRVSISLISKIERGLVQPSLSTLAYLAERLGIRVADLVGGAESDGAAAALALAEARGALVLEQPARVLGLLEGAARSAETALLRARALVALGRDAEALAELVSAERATGGTAGSEPSTSRTGHRSVASSDQGTADARRSGRRSSGPAGAPSDGLAPGQAKLRAEVALVRAAITARRGPFDAGQHAYARALELVPADAVDLRAEALVGLTRLAERHGAVSTARTLARQALDALLRAADPAMRADARRREAGELEAHGDQIGAAAALAAAAELTVLARTSAAAAQLAARLRADEHRNSLTAHPDDARDRAAPAPGQFRDASDATTHRVARRVQPR